MPVAHQGILPAFIVLPLAALGVLVIAAHLTAMRADRDVPLSRRRLRTASGVVMLVTSVVLAYAFSFVPPDDPRRFTVAWSAAIMLLVVVLTLAGLDAFNNVRLARIQRRRIRREAGRLYHELAGALAQTRRTSPTSDHDPHATDDDQPKLTPRARQEDP